MGVMWQCGNTISPSPPQSLSKAHHHQSMPQKHFPSVHRHQSLTHPPFLIESNLVLNIFICKQEQSPYCVFQIEVLSLNFTFLFGDSPIKYRVVCPPKRRKVLEIQDLAKLYPLFEFSISLFYTMTTFIDQQQNRQI